MTLDDGFVHGVTHCARSNRSYGRPARQHEPVSTPNPWRDFTQFVKANVPTAFPKESACADANSSQSISCSALRWGVGAFTFPWSPPPFLEGYEMQPSVMFICRSGTSMNPPVDLNKRIASLIKPSSNKRSLRSFKGLFIRVNAHPKVPVGRPVVDTVPRCEHGQNARDKLNVYEVFPLGIRFLQQRVGRLPGFSSSFLPSIIKTPLSSVILFLHHLGRVQTNRNTFEHTARLLCEVVFFYSQPPPDKHFSLTLTGSASL